MRKMPQTAWLDLGRGRLLALLPGIAGHEARNTADHFRPDISPSTTARPRPKRMPTIRQSVDEAPLGFSWIEQPYLAALARPAGTDDLRWLRQQGIEVLISLTEDPPPRYQVEEAGLLLYHVPLQDMMPPAQEDLDRCISAIERARRSGLGVAVHCEAGMGRTGVVLACYFVSQGLAAEQAIRRIRQLRPGSIETPEQEDAVREFAARRRSPA